MKKDSFWEEYGWIIRGSQRKILFLNLPNKPITPEEFRKEINQKTKLKLSLREMSRHLNSFVEKKFMTCLTPKAPYNKLYQVTSKGIKISEQIKNDN